jgi:hypothetical protein
MFHTFNTYNANIEDRICSFPSPLHLDIKIYTTIGTSKLEEL